MAKIVYQKHHLIYPSDKNKEITRNVRKGVHFALTILRRYKELTDEEIDTIIIEIMLKRKF